LLIIQLPHDQDRPTLCRVTMSEMSGWDVSIEAENRVLAVRHCRDWHRVECVCAEIKQNWAETHTLAPARR
jgi:hypothetical protein